MKQEYEKRRQDIQARPLRYLLAGIRADLHETDRQRTEEIENKTVGVVMSSVAGLMDDSKDIKVLTQEVLEQESEKDLVLKSLAELIRLGCPEQKQAWPKDLQAFFQYRDQLSTVGSIVMYKDRAVVPRKLQSEVLEILHSGHLGT